MKWHTQDSASSRHETTEEPINNSGFFLLSLFSWYLQELSAGRGQDPVTSQNIALASPHSAPSTLTRSMGLPVMEEGPIATVACASPTGTSVCSSGGQVRTLPAPKHAVLWTCKCSTPAVPRPVQGRSTFHTCCQEQSLRSLFSCLTDSSEAAKNFLCSNHSRKRTSEWLAQGEMKQPHESLPCRSTASTRCLLWEGQCCWRHLWELWEGHLWELQEVWDEVQSSGKPRVARWRRCFYIFQNYGPGDKTDPCIASLPPSASWETSCILVGLGALTAEASSSPFPCLLHFQTSNKKVDILLKKQKRGDFLNL